MRANLDGSNSKPSSRRARATPTGSAMRRSGASESPSIRGRKILLDAERPESKAGTGRSSAPISKSRRGKTPANRQDIEVLFDGLPEPIDLELDLDHRILYWTDRGDPPRGNTVNRAPHRSAAGQARSARDRVHPSDGGHRPSPGCERRADVHDRLCRLDLLRQARWLGTRRPCSSPRAT